MTAWVVDSSAVCEALLGTGRGERARILMNGAHLVAPQLLVPEVLSVIRGWVLGGQLTTERAEGALTDFADLGVELVDMEGLMSPAWELRNNVSAHDVMYVALARELGVQVLSCDVRLAKAVAEDVVVPGVGDG